MRAVRRNTEALVMGARVLLWFKDREDPLVFNRASRVGAGVTLVGVGVGRGVAGNAVGGKEIGTCGGVGAISKFMVAKVPVRSSTENFTKLLLFCGALMSGVRSESGKLWKHLSADDLLELEWLTVFDTPKYKGSKIFLNMVKPQFVDECRLLFFRVYQEPPKKIEIYLKFATCFVYKGCSVAKADLKSHKIAWALFAKNIKLSLKRNPVAWKRKVDAFRDTHGPINVITIDDSMPGPSMQANVKGRPEPCFLSSVIEKLCAKILDIQSNNKAKVLKNELKEKKVEFLNKRDVLICREATTSAASTIQTKITSLQTRYGTLKSDDATAEQLVAMGAQITVMSNAVKLIEEDDKVADIKIVVESIDVLLL
ncbi:hypothetical protein L7F22_032741 [Adiantum nelumboides]|nr:hypothetical protein [Adiantum nelumboides]